MNKNALGLVIILGIIIAIFKWVAIVVGIVLGAALILLGVQLLIECVFYKSKTFLSLKNEVDANTKKCNELNRHISKLKRHYSTYSSPDFGHSNYFDSSLFKFRRPFTSTIHNNSNNEYYCSLSVCKNAQAQPFKYLCKYFSICSDEPTLSQFESMLNDFSAANEGMEILLSDRRELVERYKHKIPFTIRRFRKKKLFRKLGYEPVDTSNSFYPKYSFKYVSPGGNSQMNCDIVLDIDNLNRFVQYLYDKIGFLNSAKGQRLLMTRSLREEIKERDHYTCQKCGASLKNEPHLLLEVDHIIPVSKGGKTTYDNLQTLCWRCNRSKGNKLMAQKRYSIET